MQIIIVITIPYVLAREDYDRTDDPVELEYLKDRVINELFNSDIPLSAYQLIDKVKINRVIYYT